MKLGRLNLYNYTGCLRFQILATTNPASKRTRPIAAPQQYTESHERALAEPLQELKKAAQTIQTGCDMIYTPIRKAEHLAGRSA